MSATERLRAEHEEILRALQVLEKVAGEVKAEPAKAKARAEAIVGYLSGFADELHHTKEERLLFPALHQAGLPKEGGPIAVMLTEHDQGRALVAEMRAALGHLDSRAEAFASAAASFGSLLHNHIAKENGILFPMADRVLQPAKAQQIARDIAAYDDAEREAHAAHRAALSRLERRPV